MSYFPRLLLFLCAATAIMIMAAIPRSSIVPEHSPQDIRGHVDRPAADPAATSIALEIAKQAVEQPLHFAMSAGPVWLSRSLTAVPWYGWSVVPVLVYREWQQWPSKRWWDPLLDGAFLLLGLVATRWPANTQMPIFWGRTRQPAFDKLTVRA